MADRLKRILAYHEWSAADLARAVGVTPPAVSQWISATTAVSPQGGRLIADALGEDYEYVMGRADKGRKGLGAAMANLEALLGGDAVREIEALDPGSMVEFRALVGDFLRKRTTELPEKTKDSDRV